MGKIHRTLWMVTFDSIAYDVTTGRTSTNSAHALDSLCDKAANGPRCSGSITTLFPQLNIKGCLIATDQGLRKRPAKTTWYKMQTDKSESTGQPVPFCTSDKIFERTSSESFQKTGQAELSDNQQSQSDGVEQISTFPYNRGNDPCSIRCLIKTILNLVNNTKMNQKLIREKTEMSTSH